MAVLIETETSTKSKNWLCFDEFLIWNVYQPTESGYWWYDSCSTLTLARWCSVHDLCCFVRVALCVSPLCHTCINCSVVNLLVDCRSSVVECIKVATEQRQQLSLNSVRPVVSCLLIMCTQIKPTEYHSIRSNKPQYSNTKWMEKKQHTSIQMCIAEKMLKLNWKCSQWEMICSDTFAH